jgi:molybdopterin converting factor small subunit
LTVRLFSVLKDRTGLAVIELESEGVTSVADALGILGERHPVIAEYRQWIRPAVNLAYADESSPLTPGDELALITPVSGG